MEPTKISSVRHPTEQIPPGARRDQRPMSTIQARRRLDSPRRGGRAWINGREIGGRDPRYAHLDAVHD